MSNKLNNKCSRRFEHKWKTERKTKTHVIQQCVYCKGRNWKVARDTDEAIESTV